MRRREFTDGRRDFEEQRFVRYQHSEGEKSLFLKYFQRFRKIITIFKNLRLLIIFVAAHTSSANNNPRARSPGPSHRSVDNDSYDYDYSDANDAEYWSYYFNYFYAYSYFHDYDPSDLNDPEFWSSYDYACLQQYLDLTYYHWNEKY